MLPELLHPEHETHLINTFHQLAKILKNQIRKTKTPNENIGYQLPSAPANEKIRKSFDHLMKAINIKTTSLDTTNQNAKSVEFFDKTLDTYCIPLTYLATINQLISALNKRLSSITNKKDLPNYQLDESRSLFQGITIGTEPVDKKILGGQFNRIMQSLTKTVNDIRTMIPMVTDTRLEKSSTLDWEMHKAKNKNGVYVIILYRDFK